MRRGTARGGGPMPSGIQVAARAVPIGLTKPEPLPFCRMVLVFDGNLEIRAQSLLFDLFMTFDKIKISHKSAFFPSKTYLFKCVSNMF